MKEGERERVRERREGGRVGGGEDAYLYGSVHVYLHPYPPSPSDSNGLPTSFSSDALLTSSGYQRPLSIFSAVRPSVSMMDTSELASARVSEKEESAIRVMTQRPHSPEMRARKMNIGIGHFNRSVKTDHDQVHSFHIRVF